MNPRACELLEHIRVRERKGLIRIENLADKE